VAASPRVRAPALAGRPRTGARPVLLATLGVPFDGQACAFAIDACLEAGEPLIVANAVELPPLPMSVRMGYDQLDDPALAAALGAPVRLASSLGIPVEQVRLRSPRPLDALLELAAERRPGLFVFGPDRSRLRPRAYSRAARRLRERVPCLLWLAA
jgi:hypothetical protein